MKKSLLLLVAVTTGFGTSQTVDHQNPQLAFVLPHRPATDVGFVLPHRPAAEVAFVLPHRPAADVAFVLPHRPSATEMS